MHKSSGLIRYLHILVKMLFSFSVVKLTHMTALVKNSATNSSRDVAAFNFPVERLTENVLALSDLAMIITNGRAIDHCTQSVVSVLGIRRETIMESGWASLINLMHPADLRLLKKKLLPDVRSYFKTLTEEQRYRCTFNFTLRMRTTEDRYALVAMENRPLQWRRKDWPVVYVTILRDITPFGNKDKMTLNIYHSGENENYQSVFERHYSFASDKFSGREAEIIRHIARGLTSNQIAEILYISPETVRNHRKKIMQKAKCNSSTALTAMAMQEGIM